MLFIARFGAVGGIGPRLFFPPWAPGQTSHPLPATPRQSRACHHRDADSVPKSAQKPRPASTPQIDHRPFARDHRLRGVRPATGTPSTGRGASRQATCDRWRGGGRLWHAKAAPVRGVRVRSTVHRGLGVGLTCSHSISSCSLQTRSKSGRSTER
jgi:hypothetical protein